MIESLKQMDEVTDFKLSRKNYHVDPHGEVELVGKRSISVQLEDGNWDVWLCNPKNMAKGLHINTLNAITGGIRALGRPTGPYKRLDGEGVYLGMPRDTMLAAARLLGLRVRRNVSPEQREIARQRLEQMRARRAAETQAD